MFPPHDHTVVGWRAWYTGGRVYSSADCRWEDLPANGVLVVLTYERTRPYRVILTGGSLYWRLDDGSIGRWGFNRLEPADPPVEFDGVRVKGGDWTTLPEYNAAVAAAMEAMEAPDESLRIDRG